MKQFFVTSLVTVAMISLFSWVPSQINSVFAATNTTPTATTGGDRVQDGLNSISGSFPDTVVNKASTPAELIKTIIDVALYISAMLAVVFIIYGGYQYISAGGNEESAKKGRKTLVNALIGLTLVVLSYIIVQVVYRFLTNQT